MRRATVKANAEFISIRPVSGYRLFFPAPGASEQLLDRDATGEELGTALLHALGLSRKLSLEESQDLRARAQQHYDSWVVYLMERFGYPNRRALFKLMKSCEVDSDERQIVIMPTRHDRLEGWGRAEEDGIEDATLPLTSSRADIGAALRLALSRCIDLK